MKKLLLLSIAIAFSIASVRAQTPAAGSVPTLNPVTTPAATDEFLDEQVNGSSSTGWSARRITLQQIFNFLLTFSGSTPSSTTYLGGDLQWHAVPAAGGSGTVTSFSSGNLSPLFTSSVATPTSTPALTFALTNAAQNYVWAGPASGGTGAPGYRPLVAGDIPNLSTVYEPYSSSLSAFAALAFPSTSGYVLASSTSGVLSWIPAATGSGSVTSVSFTGDGTIFTGTAGSAVTTSGTLTPALKTQTANMVLAGPGSGTAATPTFRPLVPADIPVPSSLGVPFSQHIAETGNFTASTNGAIYEVTTGASNVTVTLPTALNGYFVAIRKADAGTGKVIVNGSSLGVMGHEEQVSSDGTSFFNKFIGGAVDGSSNYTYTLALNANYNIVPSGTGAVQIGGLSLTPLATTVPGNGVATALTANAGAAAGILPLDANSLLPIDSRTINLDNQTFIIDGSSIGEGYNTANQYNQNYFYLFSQMPWALNHSAKIVASASAASAATSLTVASPTGIRPGMLVTGPNIPAGDIVAWTYTIGSTTVPLAGSATTGAVSGNATFYSIYNYCVYASQTGNSSYLNVTTPGSVSNSVYARYYEAAGVRTHRPVASASTTAGAGTITGDSNITLTFSNAADVTNLQVGNTVYFNGNLRYIASIPTSTTATVTQSLSGVNPSAATFTYGGDAIGRAVLFNDMTTCFNDSNLGGRSSAQMISDYDSIITQARADGFYDVAITIITNGTTGGGPGSAFGPIMDAVNLAACKGGPTAASGCIHWDRLCDTSLMGVDYTDTTLFGDGTHPTALVHQQIAQKLEGVMLADSDFHNTTSSSLYRTSTFIGDVAPITAKSTNPTATEIVVKNTSTNSHTSMFYTGGSSNTPGYTGIYDVTSNTTLLTLNGNAGSSLGTATLVGNLSVDTVGKGIQVKEGTNAKQGTATLASGTVTVSDTSVTASSRIWASENTSGGNTGSLSIAKTAGTGFTITSTNSLDANSVAWGINEPAP